MARHPSSVPAIERLFLRRTVSGRRTVTFRPPSGSEIVRHGSPIRALRTPLRHPSRRQKCNRQPPGSDGNVANDTDCDGSMVVRVGASDSTLTSLDGRPLAAVRYVNRLLLDLVNTRGTHTF